MMMMMMGAGGPADEVLTQNIFINFVLSDINFHEHHHYLSKFDREYSFESKT